MIEGYCIVCGEPFLTYTSDVVICPACGGPPAAGLESEIGSTQVAGPSEPAPVKSLAGTLQGAIEWQKGEVILDTYEVRGELGQGGFGKVYRIHHRSWNIDLAVKRPLKLEEANKQSFIAEAEKWVELGLHPNIVSCYYVRSIDGFPHTFAELAEGGSLKDWIEDKRLYQGGKDKALVRILDTAIQFAWGLAYAHEQGLVHQDVKPGNVLMTADGEAKVGDFGLAKARLVAGEQLDEVGIGNLLVSTGGMTPAYCSPEQAMGRKLSPKTDIWSWGVSVLEMFTGEVTWLSGSAAEEILEGYLALGAENEDIPSIPDEMAVLLQQCFRRNPDERPKDMFEVGERLQAIYKQHGGQLYPRQVPSVADLRADSLNNKALSMLDLGRQAEAENLLDQAVTLDSQHVAAAYNRGLLRWRSGRGTDREILRALDQIKQSRLDDQAVESALGWICLEGGRFRDALAHFEQAAWREGASDALSGAALARPLVEAGFGECRRTFEGHKNVVNSVAFTPDGRQIVSGSADCRLKLWNVAAGTCLRTFEGDTGTVESVAFSPDGRYILSGGEDQMLRLWEVASGECLRTFQGHQGKVYSIAFRPDGRQVISGSEDQTLKLWDAATGECLRTFGGNKNPVKAVAFSPDGGQVLFGVGSMLKLCDSATGEPFCSLPGNHGYVQSVAFSPDGRFVLSGSLDETLELWEVATSKCLSLFMGHENWVYTVAFSADGRYILSGGYDKTLILRDVRTGRCLRSFEGHSSAVNSVTFSPDGGYALSGSADYTLKLWEISLEHLQTAPLRYSSGVAGSEAACRKKTHSDTLRRARQALEKGKVSEALATVEIARQVPGYNKDPDTLDLRIQAGGHARITGFNNIWLRHSFEDTWHVSSVAFSPNGGQALSGTWKLKLVDVTTGKFLRSFDGHQNSVESVVFSPDGRRALSGSKDETIKLWDLETGACLRTFKGHEKPVSSVAFSPDGSQFLSGSHDKTLILWDTNTGESLHNYQGHQKGVFCVAFSPDGRQILSGSDDKTLKLWDTATAECLYDFDGHKELVRCAVFSPNGRLILSGGDDQAVKLWDQASGECLRTFMQHQSVVCAVAFSPNGRYALSASMDKTISIVDINTSECLLSLEMHTQGVLSVAFSSDGRYILSGSYDKTLKLWEIDWAYEFPGWADWDEAALPFLEHFLTLHTPYTTSLPQGRPPTKMEINRTLTRSGKPTWSEQDFKGLLHTLGRAGYGWLRPEGVRGKLVEMAGNRG